MTEPESEAFAAAVGALNDWICSRSDPDDLWEQPAVQVQIVLDAYFEAGGTAPRPGA